MPLKWIARTVQSHAATIPALKRIYAGLVTRRKRAYDVLVRKTRHVIDRTSLAKAAESRLEAFGSPETVRTGSFTFQANGFHRPLPWEPILGSGNSVNAPESPGGTHRPLAAREGACRGTPDPELTAHSGESGSRYTTRSLRRRLPEDPTVGPGRRRAPPADASPLIIIERREGGRRLLNLDQLQARLHPIGFKTYDLATMPVPDQIGLFRQARVVVGVHGAGLTNLLFSSHAALIELFPQTRWAGDTSYYAEIARALDLPYLLMATEGVGPRQDVRLTAAQIDRIETAVGQFTGST